MQDERGGTMTTTATATSTRTPAFETQTCGRCGGSGTYSYCSRYGRVCFGCAGRKWVLTKRGQAAQAFFRGLYRTKPVEALAVGDRFSSSGVTLGGDAYSDVATVVEAPRVSGSRYGYTDSTTGEPRTGHYVDVTIAKRIGKQAAVHGFIPGHRVAVLPGGVERECYLRLALAYQDRLNAQGKLLKRAPKVAAR